MTSINNTIKNIANLTNSWNELKNVAYKINMNTTVDAENEYITSNLNSASTNANQSLDYYNQYSYYQNLWNSSNWNATNATNEGNANNQSTKNAEKNCKKYKKIAKNARNESQKAVDNIPKKVNAMNKKTAEKYRGKRDYYNNIANIHDKKATEQCNSVQGYKNEANDYFTKAANYKTEADGYATKKNDLLNQSNSYLNNANTQHKNAETRYASVFKQVYPNVQNISNQGVDNSKNRNR